MSNCLQPRDLQHTRLPCPSLSPWVCSNSCPLSRWYRPTISSSVAPFSSCLQSFPAPGSFPEYPNLWAVTLFFNFTWFSISWYYKQFHDGHIGICNNVIKISLAKKKKDKLSSRVWNSRCYVFDPEFNCPVERWYQFITFILKRLQNPSWHILILKKNIC